MKTSTIAILIVLAVGYMVGAKFPGIARSVGVA